VVTASLLFYSLLSGAFPLLCCYLTWPLLHLLLTVVVLPTTVTPGPVVVHFTLLLSGSFPGQLSCDVLIQLRCCCGENLHFVYSTISYYIWCYIYLLLLVLLLLMCCCLLLFIVHIPPHITTHCALPAFDFGQPYRLHLLHTHISFTAPFDPAATHSLTHAPLPGAVFTAPPALRFGAFRFLSPRLPPHYHHCRGSFAFTVGSAFHVRSVGLPSIPVGSLQVPCVAFPYHLDSHSVDSFWYVDFIKKDVHFRYL